jgi:hypothetical protein
MAARLVRGANQCAEFRRRARGEYAKNARLEGASGESWVWRGRAGPKPAPCSAFAGNASRRSAAGVSYRPNQALLDRASLTLSAVVSRVAFERGPVRRLQHETRVPDHLEICPRLLSSCGKIVADEDGIRRVESHRLERMQVHLAAAGDADLLRRQQEPVEREHPQAAPGVRLRGRRSGGGARQVLTMHRGYERPNPLLACQGYGCSIVETVGLACWGTLPGRGYSLIMISLSPAASSRARSPIRRSPSAVPQSEAFHVEADSFEVTTREPHWIGADIPFTFTNVTDRTDYLAAYLAAACDRSADAALQRPVDGVWETVWGPFRCDALSHPVVIDSFRLRSGGAASGCTTA